MANDDLLMPFISSANIACGFHAGDEATIRNTIRLAIANKVSVGAHPGFADKENFGRKEIELSAGAYYQLTMEQLQLFKRIAIEERAILHHVKAHGALYNMAAKNPMIANELARAIADFDPSLIFYGLSNSLMLKEAEKIGLKTASEVFADRTYQEDGSLTPRVQKNAMLNEVDTATRQVLMMAREQKVVATSGNTIQVKADTICIHGDGPHALTFAKAIHDALKEKNIEIKSI
jgi:5-oxoprolinase (ATP-hydrolysing) subunit A